MRKYSKAVVNLAVAVVIFLGIIFLVPRAFVFFSPFVVGWIIALIAGPMVRFFEEKVKLKRKIGSCSMGSLPSFSSKLQAWSVNCLRCGLAWRQTCRILGIAWRYW